MIYSATGGVARTVSLARISSGIIVGAVFLQTAPASASPDSAAPAARNGPQDPGVRGGSAGAGEPISGLDAQSANFFEAGLATFQEVEGVADGLGPRFNLDSCAGCHAQPAVGGTSPATNPQITAATANGANNEIPKFISKNGPVREARFISDGGVHDLFTITGRSDAPGCRITQPDFDGELAKDNVIFRIPTPVFGLGLIENTPDENLIDAVADPAVANRRSASHITGQFNYTGNDGTITRFGWKAQNKSLMIFAGEAYNVEMGVTNELFQNEREYDSKCQYNTLPEDTQTLDSVSDVSLFTAFMRLLAAPVPTSSGGSAAQSAMNGNRMFSNVGCDLCHIPQQTTAPSSIAGLNQVTYSPFSDFQVHHMGAGLQDQITQGVASGDQFRTAPLWGLGQRIFFLHDGRTDDLLQAILEHGSEGSEANGVIANFQALSPDQKQDLLNFLRSL